MSWQMHVMAAYGRLVRRPRTYATVRSARRYLAQPKRAGEPPSQLARSELYHVTRESSGGFACYTVQSARRASVAAVGSSIIYVHGSAYVNEISRPHWTLVAALADATRRPVHVPLYGLAPRHCAEEALEFLGAVLIQAAARGPIYVAGDSSGAGLALAATQTVISAGAIPPAGLTLISPWLDIALTNPAITAIGCRPPCVSKLLRLFTYDVLRCGTAIVVWLYAVIPA
jgi:acetyl esterase/lipase